jgi:cyclophilin family peptidyl-prolyl cis-trans isomerase
MTPRPTRRPLALAAALGLAVALAACSAPGAGSTSVPSVEPTADASAAPSAAPSSAVGAYDPANCPTSQPEALPPGETRLVTIATNLGSMDLTIEADLSPIAAGNFVALAECGYYDGIVFHRVVPGFVIQAGDGENGRAPNLNTSLLGTGGPGYTIKDEPVTATYGRGVVAMARTSAPDSVGSQFFIVLDDEARSALESYNTYQIIGTVSSGMETADAIAEAADQEIPTNPIPMADVSVSTP